MWTKEKIQKFIESKVEESKKLEYKSAGRLEEEKGKITKDISAFANSEGGILIIGISEYKEKVKKHLPEKLDPVDRIKFSKEWLENIIIGNISPVIEGLTIYPITIDEDKNTVVYVVDIPKGTTAHQASDNRYYKRRNFQNTPMEDWEVRDVMNRRNKPIIEIDVRLNINSGILQRISGNAYELQVILRNTGGIAAQQIECYLEFEMKYRKFINSDVLASDEEKFQIALSNRKENVAKFGETTAVVSTYYEPLLPEVWKEFGNIPVRKGLYESDASFVCYVTTEYGMTSKEVKIKDIINDLRNKKHINIFNKL